MPMSQNMSGLMQPMGQRSIMPQGGGMPQDGGIPQGGGMVPGGGRTNVAQQQPLMSIDIQPGDTLSEIARRYNTTTSTLQYMNGIKNADMIFAGSKINVPNPNYSPIQKVPEMSQVLSNRSGLMDNQPLPMMPQGMPQEPGLEGVDLMEFLPVGKALGAAALAGGMARGGLQALAKVAPVVNPNRLGTPNLAGIGQVASPMGKGAVGWPGAKPSFGNVRPVSNNPVGNASMMLNQRGGSQEAVRAHLAKMKRDQMAEAP